MPDRPILIKNVRVVNEGNVFASDVLIRDERIEKISPVINPAFSVDEIDGTGKYLLPGVIDDQVHFREPGLTHKADIHSESKAAAAGGVTSFMEMPNTKPPTLTQELLEEKYLLAQKKSVANYSFYMGASNDNLEEVLKTDFSSVCGVKIFMGSSTGNLLVDDERTLERIFANVDGIIATHCEDEQTIRQNLQLAVEEFGKSGIPPWMHPVIRNEDACYLSSSRAVALARKYGTRLHVLHLTTGRETSIFSNNVPLAEKQITAEVCVHHLWFCDEDYAILGNKIKCNPAIKSRSDRQRLRKALKEGYIDIVATDHAPHLPEEKNAPYIDAPAGLPLVQHGLYMMLELCHRGVFELTEIVHWMSHAPAIRYKIVNRGFIREGYFADLVLIQPDSPWYVNRDNILYKCGWSPLEGNVFHHRITHTFVNGLPVWQNGNLNSSYRGKRLLFHTDAT